MIMVHLSTRTTAWLSLGRGVHMDFELEARFDSLNKLVDGRPRSRFMRKHEKITVPPHVLGKARRIAHAAILQHRFAMSQVTKKRPIQLRLI